MEKKIVYGVMVGILSIQLVANNISEKKTRESVEPKIDLKQPTSVYERKELVKIVVRNQPKIEAKNVVNLSDYVQVWSSQYGNVTGRAKLTHVLDTSKLGEQNLTVVANDIEGNRYEEKLTVSIIDSIPPQLNGSDATITVGETIDLLANVSAEDNVDGDLTNQIEVTSDFNSSQSGTHVIYYRVSDKSQNVSEFTREITVLEKASSEVAPVAIEKNEEIYSEINVAEKIIVTEEKPKPIEMAAQHIQFLGYDISYQNGGMSQGQSIIDSSYSASTWGGNSQQSGNDQGNTHFIGHNPGVFSSLFSLYVGAEISISDVEGRISGYQVVNILLVDDQAVGIADGVDYWDAITGSGGGERVSFQTCISDSTNLVIQATLIR